MIKLLAISAALLSCNLQANNNTSVSEPENNAVVNAKSIYDFKVEGLEGEAIDFSTFKGKKY